MRTPKVLFLLMSTVISTQLFSQQFLNPLYIPDTLHGPVYNLTVDDSTKQFLAGNATITYGISSDYLGPTLIMNEGDFITLNVTNNLVDSTTMHWHGMHVAPQDDGGPHTPIPPGTTWSPDFTVLDEATTFWYHPHLHHHTAEQVNYGAAGMILVRDSNEAALRLPRTYGVDEFPLIIQDRSFDSLTNQFVYTELADTMMVNGTLGAYLEVPAQLVRFRLLNASLQRVYNIGFPPNLDIFQIGSDGGLLNSPVAINRMQLAPGERADIIIDFTAQQTLTAPLMARNSEMDDGISGGPNGPGGGPGNPLDGVDFPLVEFRVVNPVPGLNTQLPQNLNNNFPFAEQDADLTRVKLMDADPSGFPYYINSTPFNMAVANDTVLLDDIEIWELINITDVAHPFHIHDIQFYVLDVNGLPPRPHMRGKKDVVLVNPGDTIRFITKFDDFADETTPYMYHCHNLFHEDAGMMGQFIVVDGGVGIEEANLFNHGIKIWPNPASDRLMIDLEDFPGNSPAEGFIIGMNGQVLSAFQLDQGKAELRVAELPAGMYFIHASDREGHIYTGKFIRK